MTPDPKLVEALALEMLNDAGYDPEAIDDEDRRVIRERLARHRLVQLPEEPSGWVDMEDDILLWGYTGPNDGMTPFYTPNGGIDDADCILLDFGIPGDPQEVDDG